jgi:hypothetical protein
MSFRDPVQTTVIACAAMALVAVVLAFALGHPRPGLALAAGLLLGSLNGFFARRALSAELSFRVSSGIRILVLSAAAVGAGLLIGDGVFWVSILGVGLAQLVLAAVAAYRVVRA